MHTSIISRLATNKPRPDTIVSYSGTAELFINHKVQSFIEPEVGQSIGIKVSMKLIDQLLDKLELYHECVAEANAQLRRKMKASIRADGQFLSTEKHKDIEACTSAIIPAYNNMVDAIMFRAHKLKMKPTDDLSFSMQYSRIIEESIQSSISVTNQLLDFYLLILP